MLSTKTKFFPRIFKLNNKSYVNERFDFRLQKQSHKIPLAYMYTLQFASNTVHSINYSTNAIEIPPPPPKESEVFGSLGGLQYEKIDLDPDELKEEERSKNIRAHVPRKEKPSFGEYAGMIKKYVQRGDLKRAEAVISQCKKNNDKPSPYMYTLLINAFAIHGDLLKCYKYYSEMKSRQYKINENVFTSLFNACANSPDSSKALAYLDRVQEYMEKIDCPINHAHYNVIVKALGQHRKFDEAQRLVQTMLDNKMKIGISTLNSLMYAANSNVESGLKNILQIWQLMRKLKIPPDVFTYHLLLRGIRDTHFGGCTLNDLLLSDKDYKMVIDNNRPDLLVYPPVVSSLPLENVHNKSEEGSLIGSPKSVSSNFTEISVSDSNKSLKESSTVLPASIANLNLDAVLKQNKLILFGGLEGFLEKMEKDKVKTDVKTMTYLIDLVPNSTAAENEVIKHAKSKKIPLDIDFFNMLIKKRALRGNKKDAKAVLNDIQLNDLKPNVVTYGVLALACSTGNESRDLLKTMKATGQPINKFIVDSLLCAAFIRRDFGFILELMERALYHRVRLEESTYEKLDKFQKNMTELVKRKDKRAKTESFKLGFTKFNMRYKKWQQEMGRKIITERDSEKKIIIIKIFYIRE